MPHIKNALIRYRVIDRALRNEQRPFPTKADLRTTCEEALFGNEMGDNICDSTIEKDLFAMRMELDAPIAYSKREKGYYYTDAHFSINDIPLTDKDIESIKFAANTLIQFRDVDMFKQFGFAIDKIFDRVHIAANPTDADISTLVQFETAVSNKGSEFLSPLFQAIRTKNVIYFEYEGFINAKRKPRKVVPLLLKEYRNRWYLISHDLVKETIITYALERMEELVVSEEIFSGQLKFDAAVFFKNAIGITANDELPSHIVFKANNIAAKYIDSQAFHHSQRIVKEGKNKTTFSLDALISEELIRLLLSYGGEIEVIEPIELRTEMMIRSKQLFQVYQ